MGSYQSFLKGLFIYGEADAPAVISNEKAGLIDLDSGRITFTSRISCKKAS